MVKQLQWQKFAVADVLGGTVERSRQRRRVRLTGPMLVSLAVSMKELMVAALRGRPSTAGIRVAVAAPHTQARVERI